MPNRAFQLKSTNPSFLGAALVVAAAVVPSIVALRATTDATVAQSASSTALDPKLYQDLRWRNAGPTRGGRVTAIAGVRSQPCTYITGAHGRRYWKTDDCGVE